MASLTDARIAALRAAQASHPSGGSPLTAIRIAALEKGQAAEAAQRATFEAGHQVPRFQAGAAAARAARVAGFATQQATMTQKVGATIVARGSGIEAAMALDAEMRASPLWQPGPPTPVGTIANVAKGAWSATKIAAVAVGAYEVFKDRPDPAATISGPPIASQGMVGSGGGADVQGELLGELKKLGNKGMPEKGKLVTKAEGRRF